jgi:hypothetical protein
MVAFLKNKIKFGPNSIEQNIHFHSGVWNSTQYSYSIIKKEILSIVQGADPGIPFKVVTFCLLI